MKFNCSICNKQGFKNFKSHLKNSHAMNEIMYLKDFPKETELYDKFLAHKKELDKAKSPNSLAFYLKKEMNNEEATTLRTEYQDFVSIKAIMSLYECSEKDAVEHQIIRNAKIRKTNELNNKWIPLERKSEVELYYRNTWILTEKNYKKYYDIINPNKYDRGNFTYHIDHKYSLQQGFLNSVDYKLIASPANLAMLYFRENSKKGANCSITLEQLEKEASKYEY